MTDDRRTLATFACAAGLMLLGSLAAVAQDAGFAVVRESPVQLRGLTARRAGADEVMVSVEITNASGFEDLRLDAVPSSYSGAGVVAGHVELYLSLDGELNAGDQPLAITPLEGAPEAIPVGESRRVGWRATIPATIAPEGTQLVLVVHAGGLVTDGIARAVDHPTRIASAAFPAAEEPPTAPQGPPAGQTPRRPVRRPVGSNSRTPPAEAAAPPAVAREPLTPLDPTAADLAVIPIYSPISGRALRPDGVWSPISGGRVVKNIGGTVLDIGPGDDCELVGQSYCARPNERVPGRVILRPAGGAVLPYPAGTRLEPGDALILVPGDEWRQVYREKYRSEPLTNQTGRLLGIGDPEPIASYTTLVFEIKTNLRPNGTPLFLRRSEIALPPVVWIRQAD